MKTKNIRIDKQGNHDLITIGEGQNKTMINFYYTPFLNDGAVILTDGDLNKQIIINKRMYHKGEGEFIYRVNIIIDNDSKSYNITQDQYHRPNKRYYYNKVLKALKELNLV